MIPSANKAKANWPATGRNASAAWAALRADLTRWLVEQEDEIRARRHARPQLIADQHAQLDQRAPLQRRAEVGLVGVALLVEAQHVAHARPGVDQGDRRKPTQLLELLRSRLLPVQAG